MSNSNDCSSALRAKVSTVGASSINHVRSPMTDSDGCTYDNKSLDNDYNPSSTLGKSWSRRCLVVVCVVIAVICGLLAIPTIVYHLPEESSSKINALTDVCVSENYTGSICREVLQSRQNCLPDRTDTSDIIIAADPASSQLAKDEQVCLLLGLFQSSPECMKAAITSLCLYTFPICDSNDHPYRLSYAECSAITDGVCAEEFEGAASVLGENQLPNCQLFSQTQVDCNITAKGENMMNNSEASLNNILKYCPSKKVTNCSAQETGISRVCSEGFYIDECTGLCVPECGVWEEFPHSFVVGTDAVVIISAIVYLFSSAVLVVISCINYRKMLTFPSIFIVYSVIALGALDTFVLIGFRHRTSLFCSSRNLLETVDNETLFCSIQGLVFVYALLMLELFWLFHIVTIFWRMRFPFHAKSIEMKGYFPHIHVIMLLTAIILPGVSVGTAFGTGGFAMVRFPPRTCLIQNVDAAFYSFLLPISIINAIGISLIAIIFWILISNMGKFQWQSNDERSSMNAAKLKLVIIFVYFSIASIFSLTAYTIVAKESAEFKRKLALYFRCESQGVQADRICEKEFGRLNGDILVAMIYVFFGFYSVVNLVYVVNIRAMKRKIFKFLSHSQL